MNMVNSNIRALHDLLTSSRSGCTSTTCEVGNQSAVAHRDASTQTTLPDEPDGVRWRLLSATLLLRDDIIQIEEKIGGDLPKQFQWDIQQIEDPDEHEDIQTELNRLAEKCNMKNIIDSSTGCPEKYVKALARIWRNVFVCRCMSHDNTAIEGKQQFLSFLSLVDHITLKAHFGRPKPKRRGKKGMSKEELMQWDEEERTKHNLRAQVIIAWSRMKESLGLWCHNRAFQNEHWWIVLQPMMIKYTLSHTLGM